MGKSLKIKSLNCFPEIFASLCVGKDKNVEASAIPTVDIAPQITIIASVFISGHHKQMNLYFFNQTHLSTHR